MYKQLRVRSQKSVGAGNGKFGGPDRYICVLWSAQDVEYPYNTNQAVLAKRGISCKYFGEGYSRSSGPRSALGRALAEAKAFYDTL